MTSDLRHTPSDAEIAIRDKWEKERKAEERRAELRAAIKAKIDTPKKETDMVETKTPPLPPTTEEVSVAVLKKDKATLLKRGGVDQFGFYVELLRWQGTADPTVYRFARQEKFFLVGNMTVSYRRKAGNKSARWRTMTWDNHKDAKAKFMRMIRDEEMTGARLTLRGVPMAIQLTEADVIAISGGEAPYARFAGGLHNDRIMGKLDDDKELKVTL